MSTDSPAPDSSQPKKTPASGGKPTKGTEVDLWDFDSDDSTAPEPKTTEKRSDPPGIPSRRASESHVQSKKPTERHIDPPTSEPAAKKNLPEEAPPKKKPTGMKPKAKEPTPKPKAEPDTKPHRDPAPTEAVNSEIEPPAPETEAEAPRLEGTNNPWQAFFSSLSKAEKVGIAALLAILALGATLSILHFSNRVPTRSILSEDLDLPVEGKIVKVTALGTYWREPVTTGDNPDVVRRGTKLIPVVKLSIEAKSAAIRVLFRSEDGTVVGDPINRSIDGKTELLIPATAGFDDIGMHAAYRTGESPPWIIQILEAKSSGVSIDKFHEILETEISTDIR